VPDRLDRAEKIMNARITALHTVAGPIKALYATLDTTQKKTADELFKGPMGFH
jgi:TPP-dependent trihydroxycyclohexane-1,2-dione (THcHDO) dehydratase